MTAATNLITLPDVKALVPPLLRALRDVTDFSLLVNRLFIVFLTSGCPLANSSTALRVTPSYYEWLRRMDGASLVCCRVPRARVPALPLAALPLPVPRWLAATGAVGGGAVGGAVGGGILGALQLLGLVAAELAVAPVGWG